jgi:hypothetical protein
MNVERTQNNTNLRICKAMIFDITSFEKRLLGGTVLTVRTIHNAKKVQAPAQVTLSRAEVRSSPHKQTLCNFRHWKAFGAKKSLLVDLRDSWGEVRYPEQRQNKHKENILEDDNRPDADCPEAN